MDGLDGADFKDHGPVEAPSATCHLGRGRDGFTGEELAGGFSDHEGIYRYRRPMGMIFQPQH